MNIKIENELRVRLDQSDLQLLLQAKAIEKNFSIGKHFLFTINILLDDSIPLVTTFSPPSLSSAVTTKTFTEIFAQRYVLHLTAKDFEKLQQKEFQKNGLVACEDPRIELQVDLVKSDKKSKQHLQM